MHVPARVIRPQSSHKATATWLASSPLPTVHGTFDAHVFESDGKEHVAMVFGDVSGMFDVPVRVHSECLTSEVFGSLKCDCKQQLDAAFTEIVQRGAGVVLYMRQEGRGIGLANKIRAYQLQTLGADTVDANRMLGLPDDARKYDAVPAMLEHLGVLGVRLMTNNRRRSTAFAASASTSSPPFRSSSRRRPKRWTTSKQSGSAWRTSFRCDSSRPAASKPLLSGFLVD